MKKLLSILLTTAILFANEGSNYFVDNFLKYSTFYTSVSVQSPFEPKQQFDFDQDVGTFVETTEEVEGSYNVSFGIRKLARFKYQSNFKSEDSPGAGHLVGLQCRPILGMFWAAVGFEIAQ